MAIVQGIWFRRHGYTVTRHGPGFWAAPSSAEASVAGGIGGGGFGGGGFSAGGGSFGGGGASGGW